MELKPGYKQTEVGIIPVDWDAIPIGNFLTFKNGLNKAKQFFGVGTPIVNYMDVYQNPGLTSDKIAGKVTVTRDERQNYSAKAGDVFFTRTSETVEEIGISSVLMEEVKDAVFSGFVLRGRPSTEDLQLDFKKYCFRNECVRKQIRSTSSYTTRALTNGTLLSKVLIPVPPTTVEQEAIAKVLSHTDVLIESLEQLIVKKRNIKKGAMQELLTGKRRLPGFSGGWDVKPMQSLGYVYGGLTGKIKANFGHGTSRYIPFMNVMTDVFINPKWLELVDIASTETQNLTRKGDLFFNGSSETPEEVGYCSVLLHDIPGLYLNSFCFGFRFNVDVKANGLFLAYWFRSKEGRQAMSVLAQGATRYNIAKRAFLKLEVPQPSDKEQSAVAAVLRDMDTEIETLETKLSKTRFIKQGIMHELLTGRIRLV